MFFTTHFKYSEIYRTNIADFDFKNSDLVSLGFWPGGDRDGNPYVTNEITIKMYLKLRSDIIKNYYRCKQASQKTNF